MEEVVDDLYLRKFATRPNPLEFSRSAGHGDRQVVARPPRRRHRRRRCPEQQDLPSIRRRFAEAVRDEMERRKRALKILTYDDVLLRLRAHAARRASGARRRCARLRERYDVVLVDEFQDTDPVQWDIMHRAFGQGATRRSC